jgi:hypothetical protein
LQIEQITQPAKPLAPPSQAHLVKGWHEFHLHTTRVGPTTIF